MEVKLLEAAIAGDPLELERLIKEDPDILNGVITGGAEDPDILNRVITGGAAEETPLHIAAQLGHSEFLAKIGILKPEFAHAKNSEGRCPLHLASAKGHVETVAELLEINSDVCFVRDRDGRTPLHIAAMKGRIQVLEKLAEKKIKAAWVLADCGQPILHLCANHNQFDALKLIIERVKDKAPEKLVEFMNLKDDDDNTILHLLAAKAQYQVIELLFPKDQGKNFFGKDFVNAINQQGFTAFDVLEQNCGPLDRKRIKYILDEPKRATDITGSKSKGIKRGIWDFLYEKKKGVKSETRDALMVVAILIATVTFQAQINPPGGVWQQDGNITTSDDAAKVDCDPAKVDCYKAGQAVMRFNDPKTYFWFTTFDSVGFVASLILILLLVSGFTLRRKVSTLALTVTTWIAVMSMFVVFCVSFSFLKSKPNRASVLEAPAPDDPTTTGNNPIGHARFPTFALGNSLWVALMILLVLFVLTSGIRYIWMHLCKGIIRSVKKGFKRLFSCPCFCKSSERDSEGRTDMNA